MLKASSIVSKIVQHHSARKHFSTLLQNVSTISVENVFGGIICTIYTE